MESWCILFALVCLAVGSTGGTGNSTVLELDIGDDDLSAGNYSDLANSENNANFVVPFFGFKPGTTGGNEPAGENRGRELVENYSHLRSQLDIFYPANVVQFLKENGTTVSHACNKSMMTYLNGLKDSSFWALKMLDSSGSYSSNFLYGNDYWFGSQTACLDLLYPRNSEDSPPFSVGYFSAKYEITLNISINRRVYSLTVGMCLPVDCSKEDLLVLLGSASPPLANLKSVRPVPDSGYNFYLEPIGITLFTITVLTTLLVTIGTFYDIYTEENHNESVGYDQAQRNKEIGLNKSNVFKISTVEKLKFYVNHNVEGDVQSQSDIKLAQSTNSINSSTSSASVSSFDSTDHKTNTISQILYCFSFKRNMKKIFNIRTTDSLACVHGLRVFSLLWVIAGHTCMITMPFVDNRKFRMIVERDFLFQSISNGAFSVDTFFFLSGLLISYVYYKAEGAKINRPGETASSHARTSAMKFLGGVTYRIVRLTPPYLIVLILTYLTGRWFYFNSVFEPPVGDHFTCAQYWWRNVLYINTLFPVNQMVMLSVLPSMDCGAVYFIYQELNFVIRSVTKILFVMIKMIDDCMIWSWYLADDTQFYFLGLMILLISSRYAKFATFFTAILLVSSWATTAIITLYTQHKPSIEEPLGLFDQLYDKPWTRLGPYIVGMAVGYYLARINCKATYHKGVAALLWVLSMTTTFVLVHGLYGELDQVESAAYVALSHTAWSLALSWIVIACVTGYGGPVNVILSSRLFAPFSRLSYCAYLIHPLIMLSTLAHMDGATHLQRDTMVIAIFGYFFVSYLGSVTLTILFEAPAVSLLNIFHPLKKKMK